MTFSHVSVVSISILSIVSASVVSPHHAASLPWHGSSRATSRRGLTTLKPPITSYPIRALRSLDNEVIKRSSITTSVARSADEAGIAGSRTAPSSNRSSVSSRDSLIRRLDVLLNNESSSAEAVQTAMEGASTDVLKYFGKAILLPRREYTKYEMKMFRVDPEAILSPEDEMLRGFVRSLTLGVAGLYVWALSQNFETWADFGFFVLFMFFVDQVALSGGGFALGIDTLINTVDEKYRHRVSVHEAGHFLTAYLIGVLPQRYRLSSLEAFRNDGMINVQAGTTMLPTAAAGAASEQSAKRHPLSITSDAERYSMVAVGGIAAEYVIFEQAEGGKEDLRILEQALRISGVSRRDVVLTKRWAALAVVCLLREKQALLLDLAKAMRDRRSVAECIRIIETHGEL
mmetsp:Transcript_27187/g.43744  ORF Transcript_27187/g.43744 Transcript_27187/m.43744 type:complete len:402 (-) Transcript_27187:305-1510(-)